MRSVIAASSFRTRMSPADRLFRSRQRLPIGRTAHLSSWQDLQCAGAAPGPCRLCRMRRRSRRSGRRDCASTRDQARRCTVRAARRFRTVRGRRCRPDGGPNPLRQAQRRRTRSRIESEAGGRICGAVAPRPRLPDRDSRLRRGRAGRPHVEGRPRPQGLRRSDPHQRRPPHACLPGARRRHPAGVRENRGGRVVLRLTPQGSRVEILALPERVAAAVGPDGRPSSLSRLDDARPRDLGRQAVPDRVAFGRRVRRRRGPARGRGSRSPSRRRCRGSFAT